MEKPPQAQQHQIGEDDHMSHTASATTPKRNNNKNQMSKGEDDQIGEDDHVSKLPDDVLVMILSLLRYRDAVRAAPVSRRWERVVRTQLPDLYFCMSVLGQQNYLGTPSEQRVQSMDRTLRRRCGAGDGGRHSVIRTLSLVCRKDVPMEWRHAHDFIALADARNLQLRIQCDPGEDAGAWCLELPPATAELLVFPFSYAVRPPRIRGPGVAGLRSLTLKGLTVLRQDFPDTGFPSLEDMRIEDCTITAAAGIRITPDAVPRLKHLDLADVAVLTTNKDGAKKAGIIVLADELRTLRMSCYGYSKTDPASDGIDKRRLPSLFRDTFTSYASFRLRAPSLRVFHWRCCYADEVRVHAVGRLSDVFVELAAGKKARHFHEELSYVTVDQRDKLMTDILQGLMPGLQPLTWNNIKRKCVQRDDRWVCFEN